MQPPSPAAGSSAAGAPAAGSAAAGSRRVRPGWRATSRTGRALLGVAAALLAVSLAITVQAGRLRPEHRVLLVNAAGAPAVDSSGCPAGASCRAGGQPAPAMLAAINRVFPDARIDSVTGVSDARTGAGYRLSITAELDHGASLTLVAQRLPGAPSDPESFDRSDRDHVDLNNNDIVDSQALRVITPGKSGSGCSVALTVSSVGGGNPLDAQLFRLARDPDVQLAP